VEQRARGPHPRGGCSGRCRAGPMGSRREGEPGPLLTGRVPGRGAGRAPLGRRGTGGRARVAAGTAVVPEDALVRPGGRGRDLRRRHRGPPDGRGAGGHRRPPQTSPGVRRRRRPVLRGGTLRPRAGGGRGVGAVRRVQLRAAPLRAPHRGGGGHAGVQPRASPGRGPPGRGARPDRGPADAVRGAGRNPARTPLPEGCPRPRGLGRQRRTGARGLLRGRAWQGGARPPGGVRFRRGPGRHPSRRRAQGRGARLLPLLRRARGGRGLPRGVAGEALSPGGALREERGRGRHPPARRLFGRRRGLAGRAAGQREGPFRARVREGRHTGGARAAVHRAGGRERRLGDEAREPAPPRLQGARGVAGGRHGRRGAAGAPPHARRRGLPGGAGARGNPGVGALRPGVVGGAHRVGRRGRLGVCRRDPVGAHQGAYFGPVLGGRDRPGLQSGGGVGRGGAEDRGLHRGVRPWKPRAL
ncbi:MAG: Isochorismate synthase @ Menaquinone-specific isochorismate synthase, partial [uncultured Rubrobacteraceae bacterium]